MVKKFALLSLCVFMSITVSSQIELILERELLVLVDDNFISVSEAEIISAHILKYGWPTTLNEAWAINGLSESTSDKLSTSEFWYKCIHRSNNITAKGLSSSVDITRNYEARFSKDVMIVGRGVGMRFGSGFRGGFIRNSLGPIDFIIGDYRRHWGVGLIVDRYDPFGSMRYNHELTSPSRSFDGALPSPSTNFTRGVAANLNLSSCWLTVSAGLQDGVDKSYSAALFKTHEIKSGQLSWGILADQVDTLRSFGITSRLESNSFNLESEFAVKSDSYDWLIRGVITSNTGDFLYCTVESERKGLVGAQFGDRQNGIGVEALMGGELRVVWAKNWEWDDDRELELRNRFRLIEGSPFLDSRINYKSELISAMAQVQTSFKPRSVQSALRVIVGESRKVCIAVVNGCENNSARLYQLLPTSKGYRLFSVGNESRALAYCELVPGRVRVSVERVWYKEEEIHPYNYSNQVAIRFEWR